MKTTTDKGKFDALYSAATTLNKNLRTDRPADPAAKQFCNKLASVKSSLELTQPQALTNLFATTPFPRPAMTITGNAVQAQLIILRGLAEAANEFAKHIDGVPLSAEATTTFSHVQTESTRLIAELEGAKAENIHVGIPAF